MSVPDYQTVMRPLLEVCSDGAEHRIRDLIVQLADSFGLSKEERAELLPSGSSTTFGSRVGWARTYLRKAGLVDLPARGIVRITQRGKEALQSRAQINTAYLTQFPEFRVFQGSAKVAKSDVQGESTEVAGDVTPDEALQTAYEELRDGLIVEVHDALLRSTPAFFERIVVDLLQAMGYGGSIDDAGVQLGGPGDGGVDGAIKEDKLGLDTIYVQAKKWAVDRTVGDADIRNFIGALQLHRARKGVFFTTSDFSRQARDSAARSESRVVLINGVELARLMVEHKVGVSVTSVLELKKLDSDYFEE